MFNNLREIIKRKIEYTIIFLVEIFTEQSKIEKESHITIHNSSVVDLFCKILRNFLSLKETTEHESSYL